MQLDKIQKHVIFVISLGNVLEWYDFYLYVYWAPTLSLIFLGKDTIFNRLFGIMSFFAIAFILRPLGSIYYGRLGDRLGRKKAFVSSMIVMAFFTLCVGFIPVYSQIGVFAPLILGIVRIAQTFPSGGELAGAFCYLYEAGPHNKKFVSSFGGVGNQIGVAIAVLECYFLQKYLSSEFLITWGWRISFVIGGLIGLGSVYLRYKLHETKDFQEVVKHHKVSHNPLGKICKENFQKILRGISFGAAQTVSFHFISILFPIYFFRLSGMSESEGLIATLILLALTTTPLPLYGFVAEKYGVKRLAIGSCLILLTLLFPLYYYIQSFSAGNALIVMGVFAFCLACITALWPYFLSHLFPAPIRYTCVGLSFNIGDGVLGGLSSLFAIYSINSSKNFTVFIWMASIGCLLTILSCIRMKIPRFPSAEVKDNSSSENM